MFCERAHTLMHLAAGASWPLVLEVLLKEKDKGEILPAVELTLWITSFRRRRIPNLCSLIFLAWGEA